MGYHHLTTEQRSQIYALKSNNHSQTDISIHIGVDKSSISREIKRNSGDRGYRYQQAQNLATARRRLACKNFSKLSPHNNIQLD